MTDIDARRWRFGILGTVLTVLILKVGSDSWSSKADTRDLIAYKADIAVEQLKVDARIESLGVRIEENQRIIIYLICKADPKDRACGGR